MTCRKFSLWFYAFTCSSTRREHNLLLIKPYLILKIQAKLERWTNRTGASNNKQITTYTIPIMTHHISLLFCFSTDYCCRTVITMTMYGCIRYGVLIFGIIVIAHLIHTKNFTKKNRPITPYTHVNYRKALFLQESK